MTKKSPMISPARSSSRFRLEPVCRYLFRRVGIVPALLGLSVIAAPPAFSQAGNEPGIKSDDGSLGPIVSIVKPEFSAVLKGDAAIVIAIQPRRYPAQSVELYVDGRNITGVLPIQNSFKWKTGLFRDGDHTLTVRVTDTQGFVGQSETKVFINNAQEPDKTAPVLNWIDLQNGQKMSGEVSVRLEAKDDFGVKYVFLRLNPAITPDIKPSLASWMTNRPPYEFKVDTSKFEDGLYVLDAYAWDDNRNEENAPRLTVGFYNHSMNATPFEPSTIPDKTPSETPDKEPDKTPDVTVQENPDKTPVAPPVFFPNVTIQSAPREGALRSAASTPAGADLGSEHETSSATRVSSPLLETRSSAQVKPVAPDKTVIAANPNVTRDGNTSPSATMCLPQAAPLLEPILPARSALDALPKSRVSTQAATAPALLPRLAQTQDGGASNSAVTPPALSMSNASEESGGVIAARMAPSGVRIASVAGEMPTAPAQTIWKSGGGTSSTQAAAFTMLETSPEAGLAIGRGASLEIEKPASAISLVTPPSAKSKATPTKTGSATPTSTTVQPKPTRSDATRIATAPRETPHNASTQAPATALPTPPRVAMSPNWNAATKPKAGVAIVVSPSEQIERISYTAARDETLAAIANRFKMPLAVVAAANGLEANARVAKGTQLWIPGSLQVSYKGQPITGDVAPLLIGQTSVAPFRFLFEQQGGTMTWNAEKQQITAKNAKYEVTLTIGSDKALVNSKEEAMDMAAFLLSGRTMIPVRFFEKALHATVEWEPSTGRVYVAAMP